MPLLPFLVPHFSPIPSLIQASLDTLVGGILAQILEEKRREVAAARAGMGDEELAERAAQAPPVRDFAAAIRRTLPGGLGAGREALHVIAEVKRASPSAGPIRPDANPGAIAAEYQAAGASAISVLTDRTFFDGDLLHLAAARSRAGVPILRKDFVVDSYQVLEARAYGADAVLLIVAALDDAALRELLAAARAAGLAALVEAHDEAEADRAAAAGASIIGINHRDLRTLHIDLDLFTRVRPRLPAGCITVAESGLRTPADVRRMADAGADAILVGEHLMRAPHPGAALRELLVQR
jgi:indole-3-glycerol phosphate synthase